MKYFYVTGRRKLPINKDIANELKIKGLNVVSESEPGDDIENSDEEFIDKVPGGKNKGRPSKNKNK